MIIIVEGPDGAGKSTLVDRLVDRLAARTEHLGPPESPETALAECMTVLATYEATSRERPHNLVVDRLHWGCPVYGPIYRPDTDRDGYGELGPDGWRYLELVLAGLGGATWLITAKTETLTERIAMRGDDYVNVEHLSTITARYEMLHRQSLTAMVRRDTDRTFPDENEIDGWIADVELNDMAAREMPGQYAGSRFTATVMVEAPRMLHRSIVRAAGAYWKNLMLVDKNHTDVMKLLTRCASIKAVVQVRNMLDRHPAIPIIWPEDVMPLVADPTATATTTIDRGDADPWLTF